jgi:NADPH:quinone reductase-like Zn-dependent oxidoreductase
MEAYFLVRHGAAQQAFERRSLHLNALAHDEVRIEVEAFGLNYADVMARNNMYREAPPIPSVLGYEVVGKVIAVGKDISEDWMGKRVVGFTRFGGYASHAHTKASAVVEIGDAPAGEALALATQYVTAYYMVNVITNVMPGEHALVHSAAGGVGTALIQLLRLNGAVIYAKSRSDKKKSYVMAQGADYFVNYSEEDYIVQLKRMLGNERLDVSFNPVAGETFKKDMTLLGSGSRMILFGGAALSGKKWGVLSQLNFLRKMGLVIPVGLMMRSKNILGVNMLKLADNRPQVLSYCMTKVMELYAQGLLKPEVGAIFESHELPNAHALLESGESMGKIVVKW